MKRLTLHAKRLIYLAMCLTLTLQVGARADFSTFQTYPQQQVYEYSDFSKLLTSNSNPYEVPEGAALVAQNLRANLSRGALVKRLPMVLLGTDGAGEVTSLYRYYNSNGGKYLIDTRGTQMDLIDDSTGAATTLDTGLTAGKRWQFTTYKDDAIGMNGFDNAQKWDGTTQTTADTNGSRSAGYLTADLGAPFATLATGTGVNASKWYQYRVAYKDSNGIYYFSTNRSNPILTGSTVHNINLTEIPLGKSGVTDRYIYRTTGQVSQAAVVADNTFYQVAHIADNIARTYSDTSADASITGDAAPTWATVSAGLSVTVPRGAYCLSYQEMLFIAGDPGAQSYLYYSSVLNADWFDLTAYQPVRPDDGDKITFIADYLGILTIGKTNTISKLYTNNASPANWNLSDPFSFIGCPAPYTVVTTPLGIVYLGRDGIYQFTGQTSQIISDVVTDKVRDINQANIADAAAVFFKNEYHLSYTSTASGSGTNNTVLVLDTIRNAYDIDTQNISSWTVLNSGTDAGSLVSGSSMDGKIYIHNLVPNVLTEATLTQFKAGTVNWVDLDGIEQSPIVRLGWGQTWGNVGVGTWGAFNPSSTWALQSQTGTWISAPTQINASTLNNLTWNPATPGASNVTMAIRTASTSGGISGASWSSEFTNAALSDVSGVSANVWVQIRATFTTTDWVNAPYLFSANNYVIQLSYNPIGSNTEAAYLALYSTGFNNWGHPGFQKRIRSIDTYYTGTQGSVLVNFTNSNGDISLNIPIDLTQNPPQPAAAKPWYKGSQNGVKMYHYEPPYNSATNSSPVGQDWQLNISETSATTWAIQRIIVSYDVLNKQTQ